MAIKDLISAGRKRLGMTEKRFADAIGVSRGAVQQWEKGLTAPARKHQEAVARLIGVTVGDLMTGESEKYPAQNGPALAAKERMASYGSDDLSDACRLLENMSLSTRREAIEYIRYLSKRPQPDFSADAADGPGDSIPKGSKAA